MTSHMRTNYFLFCFLLLCLILPIAADQLPVDDVFIERTLSTVPDGIEIPDLCPHFFSPEGGMVAYLGTINGKKVMIVNSAVGIEFDEIGYPVFSTKGKKYGYVGKNGEKKCVVIDGVPGGMHDDAKYPIFSPDGKDSSYVAVDGHEWFVIRNGVSIGPYESISNLAYSPDSKRFAFVAAKNGKSSIILDNRKEADFDSISDLVFSLDSKSTMYTANIKLDDGKSKSIVVFNGKIYGDKAEDTWQPCINPNGKEIAYLIKENDKWCLMVGNKKYGEDYERVWSMRYSPTGNSFAFKGKKDGLTFVNFGTKKSEGYKSVWNIALSPDGNHLSFVASNGGKQFLVRDFINDKQEYSYICDPVIYSSDSKSLAYVVVENKKSFVVNNGKMLREFEAILLPSFYSSMFRISYFRNSVIAFSPEGKKLVFLAFAEGKMLLVCNDSQSAPFDYIGGSSHSNGVSFFQNGSKVTLSSAAGASFMVGGADLISSDPIFHFNANGSQVAFGAKAGKDFLWKVIDLK